MCKANLKPISLGASRHMEKNNLISISGSTLNWLTKLKESNINKTKWIIRLWDHNQPCQVSKKIKYISAKSHWISFGWPHLSALLWPLLRALIFATSSCFLNLVWLHKGLCSFSHRIHYDYSCLLEEKNNIITKQVCVISKKLWDYTHLSHCQQGIIWMHSTKFQCTC